MFNEHRPAINNTAVAVAVSRAKHPVKSRYYWIPFREVPWILRPAQNMPWSPASNGPRPAMSRGCWVPPKQCRGVPSILNPADRPESKKTVPRTALNVLHVPRAGRLTIYIPDHFYHLLLLAAVYKLLFNVKTATERTSKEAYGYTFILV